MKIRRIIKLVTQAQELLNFVKLKKGEIKHE